MSLGQPNYCLPAREPHNKHQPYIRELYVALAGDAYSRWSVWVIAAPHGGQHPGWGPPERLMEGGRAQRERNQRTHPHWNLFPSNKHQITARLYIIWVMGFHAFSALLTNVLSSVIEGLFFFDFLDVWAVKSLKRYSDSTKKGWMFLTNQ